MKKKLYLVILIIIIIGSIGSVLYFNSKDAKKENDYKITFNISNISGHLKKYLQSDYSVTISKNVNNNVIQGDIHDSSVGGDLFVTKYLFTYDMVNDIFKIYKYPKENRIFNYYITDNYIYASIIYKIEPQEIAYNYSIIKFNKDFSEQKIILQGMVNSPFDVPNFYYDKKTDKLVVVSITEERIDNDIIQNTNLSVLTDDKLLNLISFKGNYNQQSGDMLCDMFNVQVFEGELLYCLTDFRDTQEIRAYDLLTDEEDTIYKNNLNEQWIINAFSKNKNGIYIEKYEKNSNSGKIGYLNIDSNKYQEIESEILYGRTPFVMNNMIFYYLEKWKIYEISSNKLKNVLVFNQDEIGYLYPTFIVIDSNKILIEGEDNNFYTGTIEKQY